MNPDHPVLPERGTGPKDQVQFLDIAAACRTEPGAWFKVAAKETQQAAWALSHKIKTGRRAAFRPAGHYQAYTEGSVVYAQYNPTALADPSGGAGADT